MDLLDATSAVADGDEVVVSLLLLGEADAAGIVLACEGVILEGDVAVDVAVDFIPLEELIAVCLELLAL